MIQQFYANNYSYISDWRTTAMSVKMLRLSVSAKLSLCYADVLHIFPNLCLESDQIMHLCWHRLLMSFPKLVVMKNSNIYIELQKFETVAGERVGLYTSFALLCIFCMRYFLPFFSSSLAAAFDCGTPWTVRLTFVSYHHLWFQYFGLNGIFPQEIRIFV